MAAIFGCYIATAMLHIAIINNLEDDTNMLLTSTYSVFFLWCGLMIAVYLLDKAWVSWSLLLAIIGVSSILIFM